MAKHKVKPGRTSTGKELQSQLTKEHFIQSFATTPHRHKFYEGWATEYNVATTTIYNWVHENKEAILKVAEDRQQLIMSKTSAALDLAIGSLVEVMQTTKSDKAKIEAARAMLQFCQPKSTNSTGDGDKFTIQILPYEMKSVEGTVVTITPTEVK